MLRFQKDLRPHISFSYRFRPSTLQRRICLKPLLYPQCTWSNELDACAFQYIGPRNWREIEATWQRLSAILDTHGQVVLMTSPFSDSIVFKSLHSGERFRIAPFSVIVFGVVVWTIAESGAKQLRFRLKTY